MTVVSTPTITTTINQNYFIEALGGAQPITSYLDRFPDAVYNKSIDSLLVIFMYALMGPAGAGQLRQEYLEARLQVEEAGLSTTDLDSLYTNAFAFARLADETYELDADAQLLPVAQRAQILAQDADFRNRAILFLKGARAGGTLLGISLAAQSGLDHPVEVVENWRQLFDRYTDAPLGLPVMGSTSLPNEIIVIPRQVPAQSEVQTFSITGNPVRGYFTLVYPLSQNWRVIPISTTSGSAIITVPDIARLPAGVFVTITTITTSTSNPSLNPYVAGWNNIKAYGVSAGPVPGSTNQITLTGLTTTLTTANVYAFVGSGETIPLPFNASAATVQNALTALPAIGTGNVVCAGGPLPNMPIQVQFTGQLANQSVDTLQANLQPDIVTGILTTGSGGTEQMSDVNENPLTISLQPTVTSAGISADEQWVNIAAGDYHSMLEATDQLRPWTSFITTIPGTGTTMEQPVAESFTPWTQIQVLRYVIGRSGVSWPTLDATHWIQDGVEHEGPLLYGAGSSQYTGFHNINSCISYTDAALSDPNYGSETTPLANTYFDSLVGNFSGDQLLLMPGLAKLDQNQQSFPPSGAPAGYPDPLVITNVNGSGVINDIYPADYLSLQGISPTPTQSLWASMERTSGTDYLEIDLGTTQAVNFITFQITSKPYSIDVAYDVLDQAPLRRFLKASWAPMTTGVSVTSISYSSKNLWTDVELNLQTPTGGMIYTRYLRIGFTRHSEGTPYSIPQVNMVNQGPGLPLASAQYKIVPYSVEVQNLRIGRSVAATQATRYQPIGAASIVNSGEPFTSTFRPTLYPSPLLYPSPTLYP